MSSETKFTPGPWFTTTNKPHRICAEPGIIIAQAAMPPAKMNKSAWQIAKETSHANAHLIAAAPDLYEALKAFIDELDTACLVEDDHPQADFADALRLALVALPKARGES